MSRTAVDDTNTTHDMLVVSSRSRGRSSLQASQARCDPGADADTSVELDEDENSKNAAEFWRIPPTSGGLIETQNCGGVSQNDGGRSQICCLAQDQSQDKVINLQQDVSPLTVYFIFRVCGQRVSKNPNTQRRAGLFELTWGHRPAPGGWRPASPPDSVGGCDIFFLFW